MKVVAHVCWRHSCSTISVSILCCHNYVFGIYQEVLSPLIESIKTYVDNLAVLNSRYFNIPLLFVSHNLIYSVGLIATGFTCLVGKKRKKNMGMMKHLRGQIRVNPSKRNIWKQKRRFYTVTLL